MNKAWVFAGALVLAGGVTAAQGCKKSETVDNTTTSTTTTTTTTGSGGGGGAAAATCATYCADAIDTCGASQGTTQWAGADPTALCEATCGFWAPGDPGAASGDSLECRDYHVTAAADDAATHCPHAGPAGGGVCGASNCAAFCALNVAVCTGADAAFTDTTECEAACALWAGSDGPYVANAADTTDGFACRMYHLTAAAADAATHCSHTGDLSPICVD